MLALADALAWLEPRTPAGPAETVAVDMGLGRVLASPVVATCLPPHAMAAIDGLAVRAAATEGASEYAPLPVAGVAVFAGDAMPGDTDAVLPPQWLDAGPVALAVVALAAVAAGHGVVPPGHDAAAGWTLAAGTVLGPLHLVLLGRLGHAAVAVVRRPRVRAGTALLRALAGQCEADGPHVLVLLAGRTTEAFTTVHAHGIAIRPGETSAIGMIGDSPALLLPDDPLACATAFALLAAPALRRMAGARGPVPVPARLVRKISSGLGQVDAIRVRVAESEATPLGPAEFGSLSLGAGADGLVLVPEGSEGYPRGAIVEVHPL